MRSHLESVARQTGKHPAGLNGPQCPQALAYLLTYFIELSSARGFNGFGPNPLTWSDIAAWAFLTETPLEPWQTRVLTAIDAQWMTATMQQHPPSKDKKPKGKKGTEA